MLTIIVTTLFITLVLNIILKKVQLPTIIGYILTGTIITYLFGLHEAVHNHDLKEIAEFGSDSPLGRAGQPNEVAPSYLYLASDDSSYMNGQVLHPNGGEIIGS